MNSAQCFVWMFAVVEVQQDSGLLELLDGTVERYDFVMCNPPFFGSNLEAWATYTVRFERERLSECLRR